MCSYPSYFSLHPLNRVGARGIENGQAEVATTDAPVSGHKVKVKVNAILRMYSSYAKGEAKLV